MQTILWVCCGTQLLVAVTSAQQRRPAAQKPTVRVEIALRADANSYNFAGQATCTHAPVASIYGVIAEQWTVEQSDKSRSLHLTLWRPKNGSGEMFNLSLSGVGERSERVNTVKAAGAPPVEGSGRVTLKLARGGTFTVDAKAATGRAITGTITCDTFAPASAEGG